MEVILLLFQLWFKLSKKLQVTVLIFRAGWKSWCARVVKKNWLLQRRHQINDLCKQTPQFGEISKQIPIERMFRSSVDNHPPHIHVGWFVHLNKLVATELRILVSVDFFCLFIFLFICLSICLFICLLVQLATVNWECCLQSLSTLALISTQCSTLPSQCFSSSYSNK